MASSLSLAGVKAAILSSLNEEETFRNGVVRAKQKKNKNQIQKKWKKKLQRKNRSTKLKFQFTEDQVVEDGRDVEPEPLAEVFGNDFISEDMKREFENVFEKFYARQDSIEPEQRAEEEESEDETHENESYIDEKTSLPYEVASDNEHENRQQKLTKKERKKLINVKVAKLKQEVADPELVEQWDVTAADPKLLIYVKSLRNAVPVPAHWRQKRKYLQNKRGIEKPPFQLPPFIAQTGIQKLRDAYKAVEDEKTLKQKQREKIRPKLGKVDIDYQILHDAFFKFQTKPRLTNPGDLYYELKELEPDRAGFKPGVLSDQLREALGMTSSIDPPPWLINMQRYGPPPSYPRLRIPGLNAPIPPGASFGYQPGGWGKPPVDEYGRPLYGDVFGDGNISEYAPGYGTTEIPVPAEAYTYHWGEAEAIEVEETAEYTEPGEEQEENEDETQQLQYDTGMKEEDYTSGLESSSSFLPGGLATPATGVELRKASQQVSYQSSAVTNQSRELYQVIPERKAELGNSIMATEFIYDIPKESDTVQKRPRAEQLEVNVLPEELDNWNKNTAKQKYEQTLAERRQQVAQEREDVSDVVAEGLARQNRELDRRRHNE
eukprot:jgi/Galph1/1116/GphlegSOOS_G5837.1